MRRLFVRPFDAPLAIGLLLVCGAVAAGQSPELDKLAKALASPSDPVRLDAVRKFKATAEDGAKAAELLAPLLADKSVPMQQAAAAALTPIGKSAVPALTLALKKPESQKAALALLKPLGPAAKPALPAVIEIAKDKTPALRLAALGVLDAIGADAAPAAEVVATLLAEGDLPTKNLANLALAKFGPSARPHVVNSLKTLGDRKHWPMAITLIQQFEATEKKTNDDWIATLSVHLESPNMLVRREVLEIMNRFATRTKAVVPALAKLTFDADLPSRTGAHNLLLQNGVTAINAIKPGLASDKADQRLITAQLLVRFDKNRSEIVPLLLPLLKDPDLKLRTLTLTTLLQASGDDVRPAAESIAALLGDSDQQNRDRANQLLVKIGPTSTPHLLKFLGKPAERKFWPAAIALIDRFDAEEKRPTPRWMPVIAKHFGDADLLVRRDAVDAVLRAAPRAKPVLPDIAKLALDPDPLVRQHTGNVLVAQGSDGVAALKDVLKTAKSPEQRLLITQLFVRFDKHKAEFAPALVPLIKDGDDRVKIFALGQLMQFRTPDMVVPVSEGLRDPNVQVRHLSINFLVQSGKDAKAAMPNLAWALRDTDGHVRGNASNLLQSFGADAVPALMTALRGDSVQAQIAALNIATNIGKLPKEVIPVLAVHAKSEVANLRQMSLNALARQLPETTSFMKEMLTNPSADVRLAAANAMHNSWDASAPLLPELLSAVRDRDPRVANSAMIVASRIGGPAVPELMKLLKNPQTRHVAARVMESLGNDKNNLLEPLTAAARAGEPVAVRALRRVGPPAQPLLVELMASKNADVQEAALDSLSAISGPTPATLPEVIKLLKDDRASIRSAALRYYVRHNPRKDGINEYVGTLLQCMNDKDWEVRRTASSYLVRWGPVNDLVGIARKSPSVDVRIEAMVALANMGGRARGAVPTLIDVVREPGEMHLRKRAVWTIGRIDPDLNPGTTGLLAHPDSSVRTDALAMMKRQHVDANRKDVVKMLSDGSEDVRLAAARALSNVDGTIVPEVEPLLGSQNPEIRAAAVLVVGRHEIPANLAKYLRDDNLLVREAASAALARQGAESMAVLAEAAGSKNFRVERAAAHAAMQMEERPDDLIPPFVAAILSKEAEEPESLAKALLRINPVYAARHLASLAEPGDLADLLKSPAPDVQELACRALEQKRPLPAAVAAALEDLVKDAKTPVNVLAAAARALNAPQTTELFDRVVKGVREQSKTLRDEALAEMVGIDASIESLDVLLAMFHLNQSMIELNEGVNFHARGSSTLAADSPAFARLFALSVGPNKLAPTRLVPEVEEALKAHMWRFVRGTLNTRPPLDAPLEALPILSSAYLALDVLKDDPQYKDRTWGAKSIARHHQDWTEWWQDVLKVRAANGPWPEYAHLDWRHFAWPCLLNLADFAADPGVKDRAKMLLDVLAIHEEQCSLHGVRPGRGKKSRTAEPFAAIKDVLLGARARLSEPVTPPFPAGRSIYWTTKYQMPAAAILLRNLPRPQAAYEVASRVTPGLAQSVHVTPTHALASQTIASGGAMEPHGQWQRLVFDDASAIALPFVEHERRHFQYKNVYLTTFVSAEHAAAELTSNLKLVEKGNWLFATNGHVHAALHFTDGFRLDQSDEKTRTRHHVHRVFPAQPQTTILLHVADAAAYPTLDAYQTAILKCPLTVTPPSIKFTAPGHPEIEFFRTGNTPPLVAGQPSPPRPAAKLYDSPFLSTQAADPIITVRFGPYHATYDFTTGRATEQK